MSREYYFMYNVGAVRRKKGANHPSARLSQSQVDSIRARYSLGNITQRQLAAIHNISPGQVSKILNNQSWV